MKKSIVLLLLGYLGTAFIGSPVTQAQSLLLGKHVFQPGEEIKVQFEALSNYADNAWIGIIPSRIQHGKESENDKNNMAYQYLSKKTEGTFSFKAPNGNGSYDLRMHDTDDNGREVASISFIVGMATPPTTTAPPQPVPPSQPAPAPKSPAMAVTHSQDRRYIDHGNGTITDTRTGFMWTKKDSYADVGRCLNLNDAKNYVSQLRTGGYSDWRIPTGKELRSIYEPAKKNNMSYEHNAEYPLSFDPIFADGAAYWYWYSQGTNNLTFFSKWSENRKDANASCDRWAAEGVRAIRP